MSKNLPATLNPEVLNQLEAGLDTALTQTTRDAGEFGTILKMSKSGEWLYGSDEVEVEEGSLWAVNPLSVEVGYVNWPKQTGEPPEERMAGLTETPIGPQDLQDLVEYKGWQRQMAVVMVCISGEDEGQEVRYATSSKGGLKALRTLVDAIRKEVPKGDGVIVPVIKLDSSWYKHKEYGRIYNPVFDLQKFIALDALPDEEPTDDPALEADPADDPALEPEPEPAAKPRRRRRPAA